MCLQVSKFLLAAVLRTIVRLRRPIRRFSAICFVCRFCRFASAPSYFARLTAYAVNQGGFLPHASHTAPVSPLCAAPVPLCFARSSDSVGRSGAKIPLEFLLAYCIASAPAMISVSSCVMELCLARLYCSESLLIMSSAFSVAESIACIRAAFSLAIDSRNAP